MATRKNIRREKALRKQFQKARGITSGLPKLSPAASAANKKVLRKMRKQGKI